MGSPQYLDSNSKGYITVAVRRPRYLEMAVDLALSIRATNPEPISIVVDETLRAPLKRHYESVFDRIFLLPDDIKPGYASKFCVGELTPYQHTMFLDADTLVMQNLSAVWDGTKHQGFAMVGEYLTRRDDRMHNLESSLQIMKRCGLERYFKTNSSVFCFKKESGRAVLARCLDVYNDEVLPFVKWPGDELAFAIVGGREHLDILPHPWPLLWPEQIREWRPHELKTPLYTALAAPPKETLQWLMELVSERRRKADLPERSEAMWIGKAVISSGSAFQWLTQKPKLALIEFLWWRFG